MINLEKHSADLKELELNLNIYKESIREIAVEILQNDVSKYPIFVASREPVSIGKMIIDKEELALEWSIFASTLEEFVQRKIVLEDRLKSFQKSFKDPSKYVCVFAVLNDNASFIFTPYDEEE